MKKIIKEIIIDTLKNKGKWSKNNLTMFVSYVIAGSMAFYDLFINGFRYDVFIAYLGAAIGFKYMDHLRRKDDSGGGTSV